MRFFDGILLEVRRFQVRKRLAEPNVKSARNLPSHVLKQRRFVSDHVVSDLLAADFARFVVAADLRGDVIVLRGGTAVS